MATNEMTKDASERWQDLGGSQCNWCGKTTPLKFLFPVLHTIGKQRSLHVVCLECIAFDRLPKGSVSDVPRYDHLGRRINERSKMVVSSGIPGNPGVRANGSGDGAK